MSIVNKELLRASYVSSIIFLVSACQLPGTENANKPATAIDTSKLVYAQPLQLHTDHRGDHSCQHSETAVDAEPKWVEPETVWQKIVLGYKFDETVAGRQHNSKLQSEFNWYQRHPEYIARVSQRAERYIYYISQQLELRDMPQELALLPIVESAFDPFAYSHGRAAGMWQFIPGTARHYKLDNNNWYDGRRDTVASTNAALNYLERLHKRFGDWTLALAAYNSGEGTVQRAIRKNQKAGKPTDFWSLSLPRETRSYVPKLLALAELFADPKRYGLTLYPVANAPYFSVIDIKSQLDLAEAAALADTDIEEIYKLNPGFSRWATAPDGPHRLLVPIDKAALFEQRLAQLPAEQRMHWQEYTIKNGDSLLLLAKRFNTGIDTIRQYNNIRGNMIRAGQTLLIPVASKTGSHYSLSADQRLSSIKNQRGKKPGRQQRKYTVKSGDNLWDIGRKFAVQGKHIAHWNGFAPGDPLKPGQTLNIWVTATTTTSSALPQPRQRQAMHRNINYTVRNGDSLARIASKFNVNVSDIISWNNVNPEKYLQPGQRLRLKVDSLNGS